MRFTRDSLSANTVRRVDSDSITIGDRKYTDNLGLLTDYVIDRWPVCPLEELDEQVLLPVLDRSPEMLLIGTGSTYRPAPRSLVFAMARRGIGIEVMDTRAACRTFNILVGEDRLPAAILYLGD